jgi:hypothetical protein
MKHEIKIEYSDSIALQELIEKAYFENGTKGKISGSQHYLKIDENDNVLHTVFKGLNNATVKITNDNILDGSMRFFIDETHNELRIYAASVFCIKEDKYSFY